MRKLNLYRYLLFFGLVSILGCKKSIPPYEQLTDSKVGASVYIIKNKNNFQNLTTFPIISEARTFTFKVSFAALGLPKNDIPISFRIDDRAFDSLNVIRLNAGLSGYQKFPSNAYSLSDINATIKTGQLNSNEITVSYFADKFNTTTDYLLPISISNANGYQIGSNKTIFIVAPKLGEILANKTGWTATTDSEELVGEGAGNGKAEHVIDGNINSFWHSSWSSNEPPFPHWLNINMQNDVYVTRLDLAPRQNNANGFILFNIEGSMNGISWTNLGTNLVFDPANKSFQSYPVLPGYRRFIKITMLQPKVLNASSTHLGEVNIYRY